MCGVRDFLRRVIPGMRFVIGARDKILEGDGTSFLVGVVPAPCGCLPCLSACYAGRWLDLGDFVTYDTLYQPLWTTTFLDHIGN